MWINTVNGGSHDWLVDPVLGSCGINGCQGINLLGGKERNEKEMSALKPWSELY